MVTLFHVTTVDAFDEAAPGPHRTASLDTEGFVHCSTAEQLGPVIAERYAGRDDLVVLELDPDRLTSNLWWEDSHGDGRRFPHVYGPLDRAAIVAVHDGASWRGP